MEARCGILNGVHYVTLFAHIHHVLNDNTEIKTLGIRCSRVELANGHNHSNESLTRLQVLVLNMPTPTPQIDHEFIVVGRVSALDIHVVFCTGHMRITKPCTAVAFEDMLFHCGPETTRGNAKVCAAYRASLQKISGGSGVFTERLFRSMDARTPCHAYLETVGFLHYFLKEEVLRAMCIAETLQPDMLRGHEGQIQAFLNDVCNSKEGTLTNKAIKEYAVRSRDPLMFYQSILQSSVRQSRVSAVVMDKYPALGVSIGTGESVSKKLSACTQNHSLANLPDDLQASTLFGTITHVQQVCSIVDALQTTTQSNWPCLVDCKNTDVLTAVQRLLELKIVTAKEESGRKRLSWMPLQSEPTTQSSDSMLPPLSSMALLAHFTACIKKQDQGREAEKNPWRAISSSTGAKTSPVLLCVCFSAVHALELIGLVSECKRVYGNRSVVFLNQPASDKEVLAVVKTDPDRRLCGCVFYKPTESATAAIRLVTGHYRTYCSVTGMTMLTINTAT